MSGDFASTPENDEGRNAHHLQLGRDIRIAIDVHDRELNPPLHRSLQRVSRWPDSSAWATPVSRAKYDDRHLGTRHQLVETRIGDRKH
jgi:hypothetical protein